MAFTTRLANVRDHRKHFNERTRMCYHQAPPLARVVAHVGDAGQAKPHLEHNPLSLLGACHATPIRKLNDPVHVPTVLDIPDGIRYTKCTAPPITLSSPLMSIPTYPPMLCRLGG